MDLIERSLGLQCVLEISSKWGRERYLEVEGDESFAGAVNRLLMDPEFNEKIESLKNAGINFPSTPTDNPMYYESFQFPPQGKLAVPDCGIQRKTLNPRNGREMIADHLPIGAYDESILKFSTLEGSAFLTSHSLLVLDSTAYWPINLLTFNFYTRSDTIVEKCHKIRKTTDPEMQSQKDHILDKIKFLTKYAPTGSLLLIDGPLIGGDVYTYMIRAIKEFLSKRIIPVFFVKNSSSNLVTDNLDSLRGRYNSDLHWAYKFLKPGERTNFFEYSDIHDPKNSKFFTYLKAFDSSPQRIEVHRETMFLCRDIIESVPDLIYYMLLLQGDIRNPQVRPIAIAERYARETLKLLDLEAVMKETGLVPTIDQVRFPW